MLICWKIRGLIAASAYDVLDPGERRFLDKHLASCASCRAKAEGITGLVARIPTDKPLLDRDLLPLLRARLRREEAPVPTFTFGRRWVMIAAMALVVMSVITLSVNRESKAPAPGGDVAGGGGDSGVAPAASPLEALLAKASALEEGRDYAQAYVALQEAVEGNPKDVHAGEAQQRLADLAYSQLKWYDKAYDAYTALARSYGSVYESNRENVSRLDLLAEARTQNYASLHALDAALHDRVNPGGQLEDVIARYPGTFVASAAAADLGRVLGTANGEPGAAETRLKAVLQARNESKNPFVIAHLNIEIGNIYRNELHDSATARDHYKKASENPVVARLAKDALTSLDAPGAH